MKATLAVAAGALLLAWPALLNGYPIVFSDTGAFLFQALQPFMIWDKPWIYGPLLAVHARMTLWLPLAGQVLLVSWMLWQAQAAFGPPSARFHIALVVALAVLTPAPWVASLLMPDIFAPLVVLGMFLIGWGERLSRPVRGVIHGVTAIAIAVHLSHLIIAAAMVALVLLLRLRWRPALLAAAPLAGAIALLVATNAIGHGRPGISPFGSVFMLARLNGDGLVEPVLAQRCPDAGWRLCAWQGRLPADSDEFLWSEQGPVWSTPGGPIAFAAEASEVARAALIASPLTAAGNALANMGRQVLLVRVGDALVPDHLPLTVGLRLSQFFPPAEQHRFAASLQARGQLVAAAEPFVRWQPAVLAVFAMLSLLVLVRAAWRRDARLASLSVLILAACLANALATGALSKPHHRYQARIAWLVLLPPAFSIRGSLPAGRRGSAAPRPDASAR